MSKRSFSAPVWTPTATADTTAMANNVYMAMAGGSSTQLLRVMEIYIGGQASASTVNNMVYARDSTASATPTALAAPVTDGPLNNQATGLSTTPTMNVAATTGPSRAATATLARLNLGHNAFGGIVRWVAAPDEEWWISGNGNNVETSLSCVTNGGGAVSAHVVYEPI